MDSALRWSCFLAVPYYASCRRFLYSCNDQKKIILRIEWAARWVNQGFDLSQTRRSSLSSSCLHEWLSYDRWKNKFFKRETNERNSRTGFRRKPYFHFQMRLCVHHHSSFVFGCLFISRWVFEWIHNFKHRTKHYQRLNYVEANVKVRLQDLKITKRFGECF